MSTLADLLDECIDRIPEEKLPRVIPTLNRALRTIAKRLYFHKSDLCRGELDVSIFAEDSYAADTIAFTADAEGVAGTITDSANQFVAEGFQAGMHITTTHATNTGPFEIATVAVGTLTLVTTDDVAVQTAGTSYTITSIDDYGDLPSDFWGLIDKPYLDGKTWALAVPLLL